MNNRHWTTSYGAVPAEIDPDRHSSVNELLEGAMRQFADKPAFHANGQTLTYADVDLQSTDFAAYLQNVAGVGKGDQSHLFDAYEAVEAAQSDGTGG